MQWNSRDKNLEAASTKNKKKIYSKKTILKIVSKETQTIFLAV